MKYCTIFFFDLKTLNIFLLIVIFMYVCFCPPVSTPCLNYELAGFQPKAVDIPDLLSVYNPRYIFKPPYVKDACQCQDKTN